MIEIRDHAQVASSGTVSPVLGRPIQLALAWDAHETLSVTRDEALRPDPAYLEAVIAEHADFIQRVAAKFAAHADDAEDIAQDVMMRLCRQVPVLRTASLRTWLYTVSRNAAYDYYRRAQRHARAVATVAARAIDIIEDPDERLLEDEKLDRYKDAISRLRPVHQETLRTLMRREIAPEPVRTSAIRHRAYRARRALRTQLEMP